MDGQYGNVSFICTQSDMCEPTEIWRDHNDVSKRTPERHKEMEKLFDELFKVDDDILKLDQEEEKLKDEYNDFNRQAKKKKRDIKKKKKKLKKWNDKVEKVLIIQGWWKKIKETLVPRETSDVTMAQPSVDNIEFELKPENILKLIADIKSDTEQFDEMKKFLETKSNEIEELAIKYKPTRKKLRRRQKKLNLKLKPLCALVRNEYSTEQLQNDFRSGLEDMMRGPDAEEMDDDDDGGSNSNNSNNAVVKNPLPDDFNLPVFCISANDYLKLTGIKSSSDGAANTFKSPNNTNIPLLRSHVHDLTAKRREFASKNIIVSSSDIVDQIKLYINDISNINANAGSAEPIFENQMKHLRIAIEKAVANMTKMIETEVSAKLKPSVEVGASRGKAAAFDTVVGWGSKQKRARKNATTNHGQEEPGKGLYWGTYFATVRRNGEYTSGTFGNVDFNQELCEPVEKAFMVGWERTMNAAVNRLMLKCEKDIIKSVATINTSMFNELVEDGIDRNRLTQMHNTTLRAIETVVKAEFKTISAFSTEVQRNINRSLLPQIKESMKDGYEKAAGVERGQGLFNRIKNNMVDHAKAAVNTMFIDATKALLNSISKLITDLALKATGVAVIVEKKFSDVYNVLWERGTVPIDEETKVKIRAARQIAIPKIGHCREILDALMDSNDIVREEPEFEIQAVQDVDQALQNQLEEAHKNGAVVDLTDLNSDDDDDDEFVVVKPEKDGARQNISNNNAATDTITITYPRSGLGLNIYEGRIGIFVDAVDPNGASRDKIEKDMQILKIGNVDVSETSIEHVQTLLRVSRYPLTLTFSAVSERR